VKNIFRELALTEKFTMPVRKSTKSTREEIENNPRARSARLRILQRVL